MRTEEEYLKLENKCLELENENLRLKLRLREDKKDITSQIYRNDFRSTQTMPTGKAQSHSFGVPVDNKGAIPV